MSLRSRAFSGVKWTAVSSLINTVLQVVQLAILARILTPEDFGLMAIVMVVIGFSHLFIDMGVSNAIIYKQNPTKKQLGSLYWLNIIIGFILFIIIVVLSPVVAKFYNNDKLTSLINLVALTFLIKPWGQQFMVMLHKELKFKDTSQTEIFGKFITFTVVIFLAYRGFGVYSLAIGAIVNAACTTIGYNYFGRKLYTPILYFNLREIKEYINFGMYQMGDKFLNYISSQIDTILIGKLIGIETLGLYNIAKDLTSKPYAVINPIITKVTFPLMSHVNDKIHRVKSIYLKTIEYLGYINFPLYLSILLLAEPLVLIMFGEQWLDAVPIVQILSMAYVLRSIGNPTGSLLLSLGKANITFYWAIGKTFIFPILIFIGSYWGIEGIAVSVLVLQVILFLANWGFIISKYLNISFANYMRYLKDPIYLTIVSAILPFTIMTVIHPMYLSGLIFFILFLGVYFTVNLLFNKSMLMDIISTLKPHSR